MTTSESDSAQLKGAAYHEAGHAVLQHLFGMDLAGVYILQEEPGTRGASAYRHPHEVILNQQGVYFEGTIERDRYLCHDIMQTQAGEAAQQLFCPETVEQHQASRDRASVKRVIQMWDRHTTQWEKDEKIEHLSLHTRTLLLDARCTAAVHVLAEALVTEKKLTGDETRELIRAAIQKTQQSVPDLSDRIRCPHCEENAQMDW
jgi:hypothetical protein